MKAKEELLYLKYILRSVEADAPSFIDSRRLPIAGWFLAAGYFLALYPAAVAHLDFRGRTSCKRRGRHCRRAEAGALPRPTQWPGCTVRR